MTQTDEYHKSISQKREDANLYQLYQALITEPDIPAIDLHAPFGDWLDIAMEMHNARVKEGIPGVKAYIRAFNNLKQKNDLEKRLIRLLSGDPPATQELPQEEADSRVMRDHEGKRLFRTVCEEDLDSLPDIEYLVGGLLQTASVSLLYGDSNTGKTFNGIHLAQCIARGKHWIGRSVKQGRVLYIYAEGRLGMKPRSQAWRKHFQAAPTREIQFLPFPVHLLQDQEVLLATIAAQDHPPVLLVIDPYSMCATGTNQNDQREVTEILGVAHEIVRGYGCHVMVIHHANRQGLFNGAASFKNHVDTMIELVKEEKTRKDSAIIMRCEKQRDAEHFEDIRLSLKRVELGLHPQTLEMRSSCVVVPNEDEPREAVEAQANAEEERMEMLKVLQSHKKLSTHRWKQICTKELKKVSYRGFYAHLEYFKTNGLVGWTDQGSGRGTEFTSLVPTPEE